MLAEPCDGDGTDDRSALMFDGAQVSISCVP
jgi:hypothetical protein